MDYPRRLQIHAWRWLPLLFLAMALYGLVLQLGGSGRGYFPASSGFFLPAFFGALWGPLRRPVSADPFDAVEKGINQRSLAAGASAVTIFAFCGAAILGIDDQVSEWAPSTPDDWMVTAFFLLALHQNFSLMWAAWTVPLATHCRT